MSDTLESLINTTLGLRYKIRERIGGAEKSVVFRALDIPFGRDVALKVQKPGQEEERQIQFTEECPRLAIGEKHPNLTTVHDTGEDKGYRYIAMELVEGETIKEHLDAGTKFYPEEILNIITGVASAITYLSEKKIAHKDIKPANIILIRDENKKITTCKILDLGGTISEPKHTDIEAIGLIGQELLEKIPKEKKRDRTLEQIINSAATGIYETPQEFYEAIQNYHKTIQNHRKTQNRRNAIKILVGTSAAATIGIPLILYQREKSKEAQRLAEYKASINSTLDKLEKTNGNDTETIPLLAELRNKLLRQKILRLSKTIPDDKYPYAITEGGTEWNRMNMDCWTSGFGAGLYWLALKSTGEEKFEKIARIKTNNIEFHKNDKGTINPIRFYYSHSQGYEITGDSAFRETGLAAAKLMSKQYDEEGRFIKIRPNRHSNPIREISIDTMFLSLPQLGWAYQRGGDTKYLDEINAHCETTQKYSTNEDGSVIHNSLFNFETQKRIRGENTHGYDNESCLSRAQTRAIAGFTIAYKATSTNEFLKQAEQCANYFIDNLPDDNVPFYDFKDPRLPNIPKDSSAAAIGALGLIDLFEATKNPRYKTTALKILRSLSINYLSKREEYEGLLLHGCSNANENMLTNSSLIYGDYHFIEALSKI